ncbi:MAG: lipoprotein [Gammaproteobacteria bacterium]|nr:lipoprotein [Gammaproteobacteria bacterium]
MRTTARFLSLPVFLLLAVLASACGQKGDLYFPDEADKATSTSSAAGGDKAVTESGEAEGEE